METKKQQDGDLDLLASAGEIELSYNWLIERQAYDRVYGGFELGEKEMIFPVLPSTLNLQVGFERRG